MKTTLNLFQFILSVLLVAAILIQAKGAGLGSSWGGGGEFYHSRRGAEKVIFLATIILAGLFIISSIVNVLF